MAPLTRPRRRAVAILVIVLLALGGGWGCGIRTDESARGLAAEEVPYGLLDRGAVPPATTTPSVTQVNVAVYFVVGERLQPAPRVVADPPTPARAIGALMAGPTEEEYVSGVRTAINPTTEATVARTSREIVNVDLTADFTAVPTPEQRLALGQLVFTATGAEGVTGVRFTVAGAPVGVLLPDGTVTSDPVNREAFASIAPEGAAPNQPA